MLPKRRRQLFVNRSLQGRLLAQVVVYWFYCLLSIALFAACWITFMKQPASSAELFWELWASCGPALAGSILLLPLVLLDCLRISNRFAGPIVRIHEVLQQLAEGKPSGPVQLRDKDYWQELAQSINQIVQRGVKSGSSQPDVTSNACVATLSPDSSRESSS